jgi:hypothetical protein
LAGSLERRGGPNVRAGVASVDRFTAIKNERKASTGSAVVGENVSEEPGGVGTDSEQLTEQQSLVEFACGDCSWLFAFLQHDIIWLSAE